MRTVLTMRKMSSARHLPGTRSAELRFRYAEGRSVTRFSQIHGSLQGRSTGESQVFGPCGMSLASIWWSIVPSGIYSVEQPTDAKTARSIGTALNSLATVYLLVFRAGEVDAFNMETDLGWIVSSWVTVEMVGKRSRQRPWWRTLCAQLCT